MREPACPILSGETKAPGSTPWLNDPRTLAGFSSGHCCKSIYQLGSENQLIKAQGATSIRKTNERKTTRSEQKGWCCPVSTGVNPIPGSRRGL